MKFTAWHTHPNPKKGKNEAIFLVVKGANCVECNKPKRTVQPAREIGKPGARVDDAKKP